MLPCSFCCEGLRVRKPKDFQFKPQPCAGSHTQKTYFVRTFTFPPEEETQLSAPQSTPCQVLTHSTQYVENVLQKIALQAAFVAKTQTHGSEEKLGSSRGCKKGRVKPAQTHLHEDREIKASIYSAKHLSTCFCAAGLVKALY